jgi:hypothetical protein
LELFNEHRRTPQHKYQLPFAPTSPSPFEVDCFALLSSTFRAALAFGVGITHIATQAGKSPIEEQNGFRIFKYRPGMTLPDPADTRECLRWAGLFSTLGNMISV